MITEMIAELTGYQPGRMRAVINYIESKRSLIPQYPELAPIYRSFDYWNQNKLSIKIGQVVQYRAFIYRAREFKEQIDKVLGVTQAKILEAKAKSPEALAALMIETRNNSAQALAALDRETAFRRIYVFEGAVVGVALCALYHKVKSW